MPRVLRQQTQQRQTRPCQGTLNRIGSIQRSEIATNSPAVAHLWHLQRAANAMGNPVVQRFASDRPALAAYLKEISKKLNMTEDERSEILDTAQDIGDLGECKAWLDDWVNAMLRLPNEIEKALSNAAFMSQLRDDLLKSGIREEAVLDDEIKRLVQLLKTVDQAENQLAKPDISKTQKGVQTKNKNTALSSYNFELKAIKSRIAQEAQLEKQQRATQQLQQAFDQDKQILEQWVGNNAGGGTAEVLRAVLAEHTLGSGFDASVIKKFDAADIVLAHRKWWTMYNDTKDQTIVFGKFENPGNQANVIYWKERGPQWECTRNFIAFVGKHKSNVHVTPKGGSPKSKGKRPTEPDPIG
ncbi:hypothetical protein [uncultured Roseobacter sp.]|uniref:hypothetical protein n=1 Tax=uncultured Roseobacter sp. TaxID=114847 RepID=UPI00260EAD53|nr:hypothetical protein [uncultured Roseobacter sp.]